jgi:hypothetical protein
VELRGEFLCEELRAVAEKTKEYEEDRGKGMLLRRLSARKPTSELV